MDKALSISSLTRTILSIPSSAFARSWRSRSALLHRPAAGMLSSKNMRLRRKRKRRTETAMSAHDDGNCAKKGSFSAKGQSSAARSFQLLWPPPARSFSFATATMCTAINMYKICYRDGEGGFVCCFFSLSLLRVEGRSESENWDHVIEMIVEGREFVNFWSKHKDATTMRWAWWIDKIGLVEGEYQIFAS